MKTTLPAIQPDNAPTSLKRREQWVVWKEVERNGEKTKLPYQLNGRLAKSNDSNTWGQFDKAIENYALGSWDGPGFMFSAEDILYGIDLDGCRDPETGEIAEWASDIIGQFCTYSEVSPSGTGVKMFCIGKNPLDCGKNKKLNFTPVVPGKKPGVEIYDRLRYFAVTGWRLDDKPAEPQECQKQIDQFCAKFWPPNPVPDHRSNGAASASILSRAKKYLDKMPPAISGQGGHNTAFHAACVLVQGFDLSPDDAFPLYADWNLACDPPWSELEMRHKLEDAGRQTGERGYLLKAASTRRNDPLNQKDSRDSSKGGASDRTKVLEILPYKPFPINILPGRC